MKTGKQTEQTAQAAQKRPSAKRRVLKHELEPQIHHVSRKRLAVGLSIVALVFILTGWLLAFYANRALPNVMVGKVAVGNETPATIRQAIARQVPELKVTFEQDGKQTTIAAKQLGVVVDTEATVQQALGARRGPDWGRNVQLDPVQVPLVLANDPGVLIDYAKQHYPSLFVDPKEPEIVWDDQAGQFEIKPGEPGKGLDIQAFQRSLPSIAAHPQGYTMRFTSTPTQPLIDEAKLASVRDHANRHTQQKLELTMNNQPIYTPKAAEIASWLHFIPDTTAGTVSIEVDKAKVKQFLLDKVGPAVAAPPIDRKVVIDSKSGSQTVVQQGRSGSQLDDIEGLTGDIVAALNGNRSLTREVAIVSAPFKTVTMTGEGKWIEVDLSKQQMTLYIGETQVNTYLISSGRAGTPTSVGEFAVYYKTPVMTMTGTIAGEYYYVPNVKWVSFFNGGEAMHGTYWHNNFGQPMSHGCLNMTEAAAKVVYDFAPIGTKVIVHQ